jgi:hypothetical protein
VIDYLKAGMVEGSIPTKANFFSFYQIKNSLSVGLLSFAGKRTDKVNSLKIFAGK